MGVSPVLTFVAVAACSLASFALFRNVAHVMVLLPGVCCRL